jgi:hypothetical protein
VEAKVTLVEKHRQKYGLNRCLRALALSKAGTAAIVRQRLKKTRCSRPRC